MSFAKRILILYPFLAIIIILWILPVYRYYTSEKWKNDCMIEYVENSKKYWVWKWYAYMLEDGNLHVEHIYSDRVNSLENFKIGELNGCKTKTEYESVNIMNTSYCIWVFILH